MKSREIKNRGKEKSKETSQECRRSLYAPPRCVGRTPRAERPSSVCSPNFRSSPLACLTYKGSRGSRRVKLRARPLVRGDGVLLSFAFASRRAASAFISEHPPAPFSFSFRARIPMRTAAAARTGRLILKRTRLNIASSVSSHPTSRPFFALFPFRAEATACRNIRPVYERRSSV